jgi:hypothetical protein
LDVVRIAESHELGLWVCLDLDPNSSHAMPPLLFGEMAELGEEMIPFEVFACGNCRRVELRLPQTGS